MRIALTGTLSRAMASASLSVLVMTAGLWCGAAQAQSFGGLPPPASPPGFDGLFIQPWAGLQESFTDNALLTSTNTQSDLVTRPILGANTSLNGGPLTGSLATRASYDLYANNSQLSGWSLYANGNGTYDIIPDFLSLEGEGTVTNGTVSTFGTPAIDRTGLNGRVQLSTYDVGPHLRTSIDDFADLDMQGRFAQVFYTVGDRSAVPMLPADSIIGLMGVTLDTGTRYANVELQTASNFKQDDHNYLLYNVVQTAYVNIMPKLRLIARGGYENIFQPGVVNIDDALWSGGLELSINEKSKVSVETGERYGHSVWNANAYLQISDKLFTIFRYAEVLEPSQISVNASFSDFVTMSRLLPVPLVPASFAIDGNLYSQTSLNKTAQARLAYVWEGDSITFDASWTDRRFEPLGTHDRTLLTSLLYTRHITPDLRADLRFDFAHTYASPLYGATQSYGGEIDLAYALNSTMDLRVGYDLERQDRYIPNPLSLSENVVFAAIQKRF